MQMNIIEQSQYQSLIQSKAKVQITLMNEAAEYMDRQKALSTELFHYQRLINLFETTFGEVE